jgi:hypothetical protein
MSTPTMASTRFAAVGKRDIRTGRLLGIRMGADFVQTALEIK